MGAYSTLIESEAGLLFYAPLDAEWGLAQRGPSGGGALTASGGAVAGGGAGPGALTASVLDGSNDRFNSLYDTRRNGCTNPKAGSGATTNWTNNGLATFNTPALPTTGGLPAGVTTGFHCIGGDHVDGSAHTVSANLQVGDIITVSLYARLVTLAGASRIELAIGGGTGAFTVAGDGVTNRLTAIGGNFQRLSLGFTCTVAGTLVFQLRQLTAGVGCEWHYTAVQVEKTAVTNTPTAYFDGGSTGANDYDWNGTAELSSSSKGPFGGVRTFEFWALRDTNASNDTLMGGGGGGNLPPWLALKDGNPDDVQWRQRAGNSRVTWANAWPGNSRWVYGMLVVDRPANTARLWIDKVDKGAQALADAYDLAPGVVQFGDYKTAASDPYIGRQAHWAIYKGDKSALQAAHYAAAANLLGSGTATASSSAAGVGTRVTRGAGGAAGTGLVVARARLEVADPTVLLVDRDNVSADFTAATHHSHKRASLIQVLSNGATIKTLGTVTDGDVTLDASSSIRGTTQLSVSDDGSMGLVPEEAGDLLTPYGNEIRVWSGFQFDDTNTIELVSQGIFLIDESSAEDTGDDLAIDLQGLDRAKRIVDARFETDGALTAGAKAEVGIKTLLLEAYPDAQFDFVDTDITLPGVSWQAGDDRWEYCQGIAMAIGGELYPDENGVFVLQPTPSASGDVYRTIAEGNGGVLLRARKDWTREDTYNKVIVSVEGPRGELYRGEAVDDNPLSPTYYYGPFGKKPYAYPDSRFITSAIQAGDAARGILQSLLGIGQQIDFDTIVDPALFPSDVIKVDRSRVGISDEKHVLDQVSKPLGVEGDMSGLTRRTIEFS